MTHVRTAVVQSSPPQDVADVLGDVAQWVGRAAAAGADLVVFPELYHPGFYGLIEAWRGAQALDTACARASPVPGPITDGAAAIARTHRVHLVFTLLESAGEGSDVYNAAVLLGPDGDLLLHHRKTMLTPGLEEAALARGDDYAVVATAIGRIGLLICADATCPEPARLLALRGAEIVCVSSGDFHSPWRVDGHDLTECIWQHASAAPTRAVDNNLFWVAANLAGTQAGVEFFGASRILSPLGEVLAEAGRGAGARELVLADLDLGLPARIAETFPLLRRRRPELYHELAAAPRAG